MHIYHQIWCFRLNSYFNTAAAKQEVWLKTSITLCHPKVCNVQDVELRCYERRWLTCTVRAVRAEPLIHPVGQGSSRATPDSDWMNPRSRPTTAEGEGPCFSAAAKCVTERNGPFDCRIDHFRFRTDSTWYGAKLRTNVSKATWTF